MQGFPQELVDEIIDQLLNLCLGSTDPIAAYSLVSRAWVTRTQKHAFESIHLIDTNGLEKWCRNIDPDPAGISRHTRFLVFYDISTLDGAEMHIRAFTRVQRMKIGRCSFLLSPSVAECFAPTGSNLVDLSIYESPTTPHIISSVLAALPQLEDVVIEDLEVTDDMDGPSLLPEIPFFEGGKSFTLYSNPDQSKPPGPDWIPPSARFNSLIIDTTCLLYKGALVNKWLYNSRAILESLEIVGAPDPPLPDTFTPLDLSPCRGLTQLHVSMQLQKPGLIIETILASITSSQLAVISLSWDDEFEEDFFPMVDYPAWGVAEDYFLRLAKRFNAGSPGREMEVMISWTCSHSSRGSYFLACVEYEKFLPRLKEEVMFSLYIND